MQLTQPNDSSDVTLDVLFGRCLHDDLLLPTLEFDTDCSTHLSRQRQLCVHVLTTGCKKSIPSISRRGSGGAIDTRRLLWGGGGGGGGGGGKDAALHELAGAIDVRGAEKAVLGAGGSVLVCKPAREAATFTA